MILKPVVAIKHQVCPALSYSSISPGNVSLRHCPMMRLLCLKHHVSVHQVVGEEATHSSPTIPTRLTHCKSRNSLQSQHDWPVYRQWPRACQMWTWGHKASGIVDYDNELWPSGIQRFLCIFEFNMFLQFSLLIAVMIITNMGEELIIGTISDNFWCRRDSWPHSVDLLPQNIVYKEDSWALPSWWHSFARGYFAPFL